jgi:hypothetical protein
VVEGKSAADIASTLFLSPKTVDTYRSRLMQKLGLDSFAALVKFAIACGLTLSLMGWRLESRIPDFSYRGLSILSACMHR